MFRNNPILGIGIGGWHKELKKMVGQHKAPAFLMQFNQTHSIYLDALSTRGLVGILSLLLLTACPLYYTLKSREPENALFRNVVMLVAIAFMVSGLTDTSYTFVLYLCPISQSPG
jgi:O-antigen ligase